MFMSEDLKDVKIIMDADLDASLCPQVVKKLLGKSDRKELKWFLANHWHKLIVVK